LHRAIEFFEPMAAWDTFERESGKSRRVLDWLFPNWVYFSMHPHRCIQHNQHVAVKKHKRRVASLRGIESDKNHCRQAAARL
jgi:hypothetical protein